MSHQSRIETLELLQKWEQRVLDEVEVHERAEELFARYASTDKVTDRIAYEVLAQLEILNHQLVTIDDVPQIIDILNAPIDCELETLSRWRNYWDHINYEQRRRELASNSYYITD